MRALVTGAAGFVGRHLVEALTKQGASVTGLDRSTADLLSRVPAAEPQAGDLADAGWVQRVVAGSAPDLVFHLAGLIGTADQDAARFFAGNVLPTIQLLEAVRLAAPAAVVVLASSSAVYGDAGGPQPVGEDVPIRPRTAYGASKASQEMLALQYWLGYRVRTVRVRAFNLVGPGQGDTLMAGALAKQIAEREAAGGGTVSIGDTRPRRDFLDVRDAADAYLALAQHGVAGEAYNVCAGRSWSIAECVAILVGQARAPIEVVTDPARLRPIDIEEQVGDAAKLTEATAWRPRIALATSLSDLLDDFRRRRAS